MDGLTELQNFDAVGSGSADSNLQPQHKSTQHQDSPFIAADAGAGPDVMFDEVLKARDQERRRIGQELHDSAGQLLVSLQLSISQLRHVHEASELDLMLDEIRDTVRQIDTEIRSLSFLNVPAELGSYGLAAALRMLANGFSRRTGICVSFDSAEIPAGGGPTSTALLRVAQEALVNIHRHSHATAARMELRKTAGFLRLMISDNGVGMPAGAGLEESAGVGIRGMRFRVEQLGGRFEIRKAKRGSRIAVSVPIRDYQKTKDRT